MTKLARPGMWCNGDSTVVEIVTDKGTASRGVIVRWTGPGECVLDNGASGVLVETYARRAARSKP